MLHLLLAIIGLLTPNALAVDLEQVGAGAPGVSDMWTAICSVVPYCAVPPGGALVFFANRVILIVMSLVSIVAVLMIIYASVQLSSAQMDEGKVDEAKKIIMYALIGLVCAIVGQTFLGYLVSIVLPALFS